MQIKRLSESALILLCAAVLGSAQSQNEGAVGRGVSISFQNASGSADRGVSVGFHDAGGTIQVVTNSPAATFTITGPATYTGSGTSFTQTNAPAGTYTITYGAVNCFSTPVSETKTLTGGGSVNFGNTALYSGNASVTVSVMPAAASSATFSINPTIPGMKTTGPYPVTRSNVWPQPYTIIYNNLAGFVPPPSQTVSPDGACRISFSGTYLPVPSSGTATLSVRRNVVGATFTITNSATGVPLPGASNVGGFGPTQVPGGTYVVKYNTFSGYYTPAVQKVTLKTGDSLPLEGKYRRIVLLSFTGWNDAPSASNCLPLGFNGIYSPGSGIEYHYNQLNQDGRGMTKLILEVLSNGALNPPSPIGNGLKLDAFTFYGSNIGSNFSKLGQNGDACTAPSMDFSKHYEAAKWMFDQLITSDDYIVVVGHSYGGNRARLFVQELQDDFGLTAKVLVTVDAIDWQHCHITEFLQNTALSFGLCDQHGPDLQVDPSPAEFAYSFYQTQGASGLPIMGYRVPGAPFTLEPNDNHFTIDDDAAIHQFIIARMLDLARGPQVSVSPAGSGSRSGNVITMPVRVSISGLTPATGVGVTSASLNGVAAINISSAGNLGDIAGGGSASVGLTFPGAAATSGSNGVLSVSGEFSYGVPFSFQFRVAVP